MASTFKITMEELYQEEYKIIAIHSSLEDYRLAYFINQSLSIRLKKCNENLHIRSKKGDADFSLFEYEDKKIEASWNLIENKVNLSKFFVNQVVDLFSDEQNEYTQYEYLLPEYKNVDFFLKINDDINEFSLHEIINKISTIDHISMAYSIDNNKIKTKNNLIF